jgi:glutathione peroxidase
VTVHDLSVTTADGDEHPLAEHAGRVLLVVNVASGCGLTYDVTFPVLAKIDVNGPSAHPLFRHLRAAAPGELGPQDGPLHEHLARTRPEALRSDEVKWNFTKFLVGRDGEVLRRYEPTVLPEDIRPDLEALLT